MPSRVFNAIKKWKQEQTVAGGRGNIRPTEFMRVPLDVMEEFDTVLDELRQRYGDFPDSPRNERLFSLLNRLDEMFPSDDRP